MTKTDVSLGKYGRAPGERSLGATILLFVLPLIATSVLQLLFNTADTLVVGRYGGDTEAECEAALAAVGSCGALINLLVGAFLGLSVGAGVLVAQNYGAGDREGIERTTHTAFLIALIAGIVVTVPGELFSGKLLTLMGTDDAALAGATGYMRAYFIGVPAAVVYNYLATELRSIGDTRRPLIFLTIGGVLNVFLNLFFVLVLRLGAVGVGLATGISQWLSCLLILIYVFRADTPCRLSIGKLRIHGATLSRMLLIGIPAAVQSIVFSFSNVLIQSAINSFHSTAVVAGNTAGGNIDGYVYMIQNSFYHAAITYVGQFYGARRFDRIKKTMWTSALFVTVSGLFFGGMVNLFAEPLLGLYLPGNAAAIAYGVTRLRYVCIPYFLCGVMEVGSGTLRGYGHSLESMAMAIIGSCVFRVVWIYTVFRAVHTLPVLYLSYPITWILTSAAYFITVAVIHRRLCRSLA